MFRKLIACIVCICITLISINAANNIVPENTPSEIIDESSLLISPTNDQVTLYINDIEFYCSAYLRDGITYVSIEEFCSAVVGESVLTWDADKQYLHVSNSVSNLSIGIYDKYILSNGRYIYLQDGAMIVEDSVFVPVRILAKAIGAEIVWDNSVNSVHVTPGVASLLSGEQYYDSDSVYWLSRIISAEARGEPIEGQIAVGNVVMNRVAYEDYPSTIYDVIFDRVGGVQFTPVANGTIYDEPTQQAIIAAKLVLDGANTAGNSLFFMNESIATSKWMKSRTLVSSIGNHDFYV